MRHVPAALLALLTLAVAGLAACSLAWRIEHDAPILFYVAYLIDAFDRVPYREIFDMNLPGTYAAYGLIGRATSYGDAGIRWVDVGLVVLLSTASYRALASIDRRGALCGAVLFAAAYLGYGPRMSLQREFLVLVLAGLALWAVAARRWGAAGLAIGVAITIKPHAGLLVLPLVVEVLRGASGDARGGNAAGAAGDEPAPATRRLARAAWLFAGLLLPGLGALVYLVRVDALGPFLALARGYWPLYGQIGQDLALVAPEARLGYLLRGMLRMGAEHSARGASVLWSGHLGLLPAALLGFAAARRSGLDAPARGVLRVLAGFALCLFAYPLASGQFWDYHWLPFEWAALLLGGLTLAGLRQRGRALAWGGGLALVLAAALTLRLPEAARRTLSGDAPLAPKGGRPDAIAAYLRERARAEPLGPVQVLDWTGGGVHGLLLAEVELATSFVYDFHFYHHPEAPFIAGLRERFLAELAASQPRLVIEVQGMKPNVRGPGTTQEFAELRAYLAANYRGVHAGRGFRVFELR